MTRPATTATRLIRAADRHHWANEWLDSRQSFPATGNYDLFGNAHGVLLVSNDDVVAAGEGLDAHQHRNTEILTWVVEGAVAHKDSRGHREVLHPGTLGYMRAGRGITHSEGNAATRSEGRRVRVVQMWVAPDTDGLPPDHADRDFTAALAPGGPVVVASGLARHQGSAALVIANRFAALHVARPQPGRPVRLPDAPFGHLFVVGGPVEVEGIGTLYDGDALRTIDAGELTVTAAEPGAEVLYWEMHASFGL
ncbi:hypothetical protein GOHSU_38_00070 [Gordonia hirsuta DSM 44140 = NBRC 16056]|uniref:Pirin N-terminal domain-containing protein n=1 Tax=Gordonia hirsuta DSM 44140 = NBRC 16056 TaxID=1121927 RepID=L7LE88_9ACTN|nr:pirin family protein [Gordonia hirsuta]GAC58368.1 hypothetical protein GOHSU_38_00070 [Gordonia hirsuta DSM 44140 = NBRC 16056]